MLKSKPNFSNWKSLKARSHNFELVYSVDCNWYLILLLHKYAFQTTCNHWNRRLQIKEGLFRSQSKLDNDQTSIPKNLVLTIKLQWNFRHLVVFLLYIWLLRLSQSCCWKWLTQVEVTLELLHCWIFTASLTVVLAAAQFYLQGT